MNCKDTFNTTPEAKGLFQRVPLDQPEVLNNQRRSFGQFK